MAKDALEKALKDLHGEIIKEIEKNKKAFSEEVKNTLTSFQEELEKNVTAAIDHRISALFAQHFSDTSSQVRENFHDMFSPVLERIKEDMQRLHMQGEDTLQAWKNMMRQFSSLWTKPFVALVVAVAFMGSIVCLYFFLLTSSPLAFLLMNDSAKEAYANEINRIKSNERYRVFMESATPEAPSQPNSRAKTKKKTK